MSGHPPPRKELYYRKTDFLLLKSSSLFKFHQSERRFLVTLTGETNKKLDFTKRKSAFRW